jgi:nitrogen fixation/metabolism regulation signal transduction histidine kinase
VVGGRFLDDAFVEGLGGDAGTVQVLLTDAGGTVPAEVGTGGGRRDVFVFEDEDGAPAARLVAVVDDAELIAQLDELDRGFILAGSVAAMLALVFALLLSWSLTRPLRELEAAADRVAAGDLESTLGVRSGGEVGRVMEAFNRMTHDLRHTREKLLRAERIAAWRDIARRIAHEVKNPLSPIQVSIETMRKTYAKKHPDFDEIFEESTLTILEEVERLKRIVTEFSRFARMPRPKPEELSVSDVVTHVAGLHQGGPVAVDVVEPDDLPTIRADREQLTQVLVNLVQNAADAARARHGDRGGHVRVVLERDDDGHAVCVRIQDDGPGIPDDQRDRVFEPYYTTKAGGTGLGLAIVHRIVGDHGGSIHVRESPLGGAEFVVRLTEQGPPKEAAGSLTDTASPLLPRL